MKTPLAHHLRVVHSKLREAVKRVARSPRWVAIERATRTAAGKCAACASTENLQVHHVEPFHLHPELELDPTNLIVLCMGPNECHLRLRHGDNFKTWNATVRTDAVLFLTANAERRALIQLRVKTERRSGA